MGAPPPTGKAMVISIRVHPALKSWAVDNFDGEIIIDENLDPGTVKVVPLAYAEHITATIGFANPGEPKQ